VNQQKQTKLTHWKHTETSSYKTAFAKVKQFVK